MVFLSLSTRSTANSQKMGNRLPKTAVCLMVMILEVRLWHCKRGAVNAAAASLQSLHIFLTASHVGFTLSERLH